MPTTASLYSIHLDGGGDNDDRYFFEVLFAELNFVMFLGKKKAITSLVLVFRQADIFGTTAHL